MYVGFTKLILFAIAIGAAQTPTAIASSSSSSGTTATDLINSDAGAASSSNANGNINIIGNRLLQVSTCVCSPSTYTFTLNFSGTCPGNISNAGVAFLSCSADPTPVEIDAVLVQEYDTNNVVLKQQKYDGSFSDGDTIQYTSISDSLDPNVSLSGQQNKIPDALFVNVQGTNELGVEIKNNIFIVYTLSCDVEPIASGSQVGWIEISNYEPAIPAFCSAVTYAPTETPSEAPTATAAPTVTPSEAPTESESPTAKAKKSKTPKRT
jgi:hypothetical protein